VSTTPSAARSISAKSLECTVLGRAALATNLPKPQRPSFNATEDKDGLFGETELHDFSAMRFNAIVAPY
jgi:hypothetical protein